MLKTLFLVWYVIKCRIQRKKIMIFTYDEFANLMRKTHGEGVNMGWDTCLEHIGNKRETISAN